MQVRMDPAVFIVQAEEDRVFPLNGDQIGETLAHDP